MKGVQNPFEKQHREPELTQQYLRTWAASVVSGIAQQAEIGWCEVDSIVKFKGLTSRKNGYFSLRHCLGTEEGVHPLTAGRDKWREVIQYPDSKGHLMSPWVVLEHLAFLQQEIPPSSHFDPWTRQQEEETILASDSGEVKGEEQQASNSANPWAMLPVSYFL